MGLARLHWIFNSVVFCLGIIWTYFSKDRQGVELVHYQPFEIYPFSFFFPVWMWDLSSPTRDQTCAPTVEVESLNRWSTREVPGGIAFYPHLTDEEL